MTCLYGPLCASKSCRGNRVTLIFSVTRTLRQIYIHTGFANVYALAGAEKSENFIYFFIFSFLLATNIAGLMNHSEEDSSASSSSSSSSPSSSLSSSDITATKPSSPLTPTKAPPIMHKRKAGRKKFKETRHPIYRGVRRRNGDKWVCEVREPKKKSRIWLGTFPSPEMAARAHDVAVLALHGETMAKLNFPDSFRILPRAKSSSARDIQIAALQAARASIPAISPSSTPSFSSSSSKFSPDNNVVNRPPSIILPSTNSSAFVKGSIEVSDSDPSMAEFMDEEALFNFPGLVDSMAEGMLLTPPAMKRGFNWGDVACDMDLSLWSD